MPPVSPDAPVGRVRGPESRPTPSKPPDRPSVQKPRGAAPRAPRATHQATVRSAPPSEPDQHPKPEKKDALETLLADLGSQLQTTPLRRNAPRLQRGSTRAATEAATHARFHATGLPTLDEALGGGFPTGRLSELCGAPSAGLSAGRTALALGLLAEPLARGELAAWIDLADGFDPRAAQQTLVARGGAADDLDGLLWVRARDEREALRGCERLLQTEGFELVVFDLLRPRRPGEPRLRIQDVTWLRLARLARATRTTLLALSGAPSTGTRAELVLELQPQEAAFAPAPALLESLAVRAVVRRHRSRPAGLGLPLRLHADPSDPPDEEVTTCGSPAC